jgi:hypothetical protein
MIIGQEQVHMHGGFTQPTTQDVNVDVTTRGAQSNLPPPRLPNIQPPPQVVNRNVNVRVNPGSPPNLGAQRMTAETTQGVVPGSEQVNVTGSAQQQAGTERVEVDVNARVAGNNLPPPRLPNNLPTGQQRVNQDIRVNIVSNSALQGGTQQFSMDAPAGNVVSGGETVSMTGGGASSGANVTENTRVDMVEAANNATRPAGNSAAQAASIAAGAASNTAHTIHYAQQFIIDMHAAGFRDDQIQDPRIVQTALDVYDYDETLLPTAAVVAQKLGPNDFTMHSVQVVEQMVEAGWNANQIGRPDIVTADAIMNSGGGYPTPRYVREVRYDQRFSPKMGKGGALPKVPTDLAMQWAKGMSDNTTPDKVARILPF